MKKHLILWLLVMAVGCARTEEQQFIRHAERLLKDGDFQTAWDLTRNYEETHPDSIAAAETGFILLLRLEQGPAAAAAFERLPDKRAALTRALRRVDPTIRAMAAQLAATQPEVVSLRALRRAAGDSVVEVRRHAIRALGNRRDPATMKALFRGLNDGDWMVRAEAADAFGRLGDPRASQWLLVAVDGPDGYVRYRAGEALKQITTAASAEKLVALLPRVSSRQQAYIDATLAARGDPRALDGLVLAAKSSDEELRQLAADGLGNFSTEIAVECLRRLQADVSPRVQQHARNALRRAQPSSSTTPGAPAALR